MWLNECPAVVRKVEGASFCLCPVCGMSFGGDKIFVAHPNAQGIGISKVIQRLKDGRKRLVS